MTRRHESDRENMRQEAQRRILAVRESGEEKHNQVYGRMTDKLRYIKARSEMVMQDVSRLQSELQDRKSETKSMVEGTLSQLQAAETQLIGQCEGPKKRHMERTIQAEENINEHNVKLRAENEAKQSEILQWSHKHAAIATRWSGHYLVKGRHEKRSVKASSARPSNSATRR